MKAHFQTLAGYNRWANQRLYEAVAALSDAQYRQDAGAFFASLHGTLNHILVGDRVWLRRLTGEGPQPARLNEILFEDFASLRAARAAEDERIVALIESYGDADWDRVLRYANMSGATQETPIREVLAHFFNHQTHHRGQAHAILTSLGQKSVELDLILFLRARAKAA